jgi:subtilisin family serine protease
VVAGADERGRQVRAWLLALVPLLAVGLLAPAGARGEGLTGRLLVLLRPAHGLVAREAAARAVVASAGARAAGRSVPQIGLVTVRPHRGESLRALARRLRADPRVEQVAPERRFSLRYVPDDPALSVQDPSPGTPAGTVVEWWAAREDLPAAWDISKGDGAVVAVIDTGIDQSHPEFAGRVAGTIDLDSDPSDGPATSDLAGHGTHVASLACATADNGVGIAGAGFACSLLVIKSDLSDSSVSQAIVDATDRGADSINMSFGTDGSTPASPAIVRAIDYAYDHGIPMVAAAADDKVTEQGDPANVLQPTGTGPDINAGKGLTVTAANFFDQRASFAGLGTQISMAAYGAFEGPGPRGILGAFPGNPTLLEAGPPPSSPCGCRTTFQGDNRYAYVQGTSMSTPMVAAIAALVHHANPDLGAAGTIRILKETARRPAGGWTPDLGWGILDGGAALEAALHVDRTPPVSHLIAPAVVHGRHLFTLRWTGYDPSPPGLTASGIARYEVWRSTNGAAARRIAVTAATRLRVRGRPGSTYAYYTLAVDNAGNREAPPARPYARVRVVTR